MNVIATALPEVLILEPNVFGDERGFFFESYNRSAFRDATGVDVDFVQDNHSRSMQGVLRGLHYQLHRPQGKLVRVVHGAVLDVAVDIRRTSPSFGKCAAVDLSALDKRMLWIPQGFAHGFLVLSESAEVLYKVTEYSLPERERCIRWDDPDLALDWRSATRPLLSARDAMGASLRDAEVYA